MKDWHIHCYVTSNEVLGFQFEKQGHQGAVWFHFFLSLNFHYSTFITHISSLNFSYPFGIITKFPSFNIFHTICEPIPVSRCNFFFFFFQYPNSSKLLKKRNEDRTVKKKKKRTANPGKRKKKKNNEQPTQEKEKEKKWRAANPGKRKKKKVKSGQKLRLVLFASPSCVFNYKNAIELWVMETENCQKLFSISITHNSKIRELSDRNRVIICQTTFLLWFPPFLSYELWKQKIELSKKAI